MASIEKRGRTYRVIFRYRSVKYAQALSTKNEADANTSLARLEANLHDLAATRGRILLVANPDGRLRHESKVHDFLVPLPEVRFRSINEFLGIHGAL